MSLDEQLDIIQDQIINFLLDFLSYKKIWIYIIIIIIIYNCI